MHVKIITLSRSRHLLPSRRRICTVICPLTVYLEVKSSCSSWQIEVTALRRTPSGQGIQPYDRHPHRRTSPIWSEQHESGKPTCMHSIDYFIPAQPPPLLPLRRQSQLGMRSLHLGTSTLSTIRLRLHTRPSNDSSSLTPRIDIRHANILFFPCNPHLSRCIDLSHIGAHALSPVSWEPPAYEEKHHSC